MTSDQRRTTAQYFLFSIWSIFCIFCGFNFHDGDLGFMTLMTGVILLGGCLTAIVNLLVLIIDSLNC